MNWSRTEISFTACRLLILYLLVYGIQRLTKTTASLPETSWGLAFGSLGANVILVVLPIIFLWYVSRPLAKWMAGPTEPDDEPNEDEILRIPETTELMHVGIVVLGIGWVINGIYQFVYWQLYLGFKFDPLLEFKETTGYGDIGRVWASVIAVIFGVTLVLFGNKLAEWIRPNNRSNQNHTNDAEPTKSTT